MLMQHITDINYFTTNTRTNTKSVIFTHFFFLKYSNSFFQIITFHNLHMKKIFL